MKPDVVVIGAGAAGLVATLTAARGGRHVLLLEAARDPGRKILVSGGGRCNVLPMEDAPARFVSEAPARLVRRCLDRWPLAAQREFFEELLGGPLREEKESLKLFPPSNRAVDVRDALRFAVASSGATLRAGAPVRGLSRAADGGDDLIVRLDGDEEIRAPRVILATGGRSVLAGGADAAGFSWAEALGHRVHPTYPALAPLTGEAPAHRALSGVSLTAIVTAESGDERASSRGGFLFTHKGWSGPAVLDVSHVVERARLAGRTAQVRICFGLGGEGAAGNDHARGGSGSQHGSVEAVATAWNVALREGAGFAGGRSLASFLSKSFPSSSSSLPDRLVRLLLETAGVADQPLARLARDARARVVETLAAFPIPVTGTEGYRTAEVTGGGVALEEIDPGSGLSRIVPGLHFAGEILDAFGPIGGFNFQWAWATGRSAGAGASRA